MLHMGFGRIAGNAAALLVIAIVIFLLPYSLNAQQPSTEQEHSGHEGMQHDGMDHDHMNMPMDGPEDPAAAARLRAKILADKKESEFNHHLAGLFVAIAGLFML